MLTLQHVRLTIEAKATARIRDGHPWVYREAIRQGPKALPRTGDFVDLFDPEGAAIGWGIFEESSPIAVRVHGRSRSSGAGAGGGAGAGAGAGAIERAIERAIGARDGRFDPGVTSAYRLVNGEGDRVPGMVIDRYGPTAVARVDGAAMALLAPDLLSKVRPALAARGVTALLVRGEADAHGQKVNALWGELPNGPVDVVENGVVMEVDLLRGQKTGAFLDQRDNRARVRALARGRSKVLNLFSYAGGFSVAAGLAGASVTSVDIAAGAHATAQRSFKKNGLTLSAHKFVTADAVAHAEELGRRGERFDLIISDPPSYAPSEKTKGRALGAYAKLHRACASLLAKGGVLCASSCSSHVTLEDFFGTLDDRALDRDDLVVRGAFGLPEDHPTPPVFPEGRYLKFVVLG